MKVTNIKFEKDPSTLVIKSFRDLAVQIAESRQGKFMFVFIENRTLLHYFPKVTFEDDCKLTLHNSSSEIGYFYNEPDMLDFVSLCAFFDRWTIKRISLTDEVS